MKKAYWLIASLSLLFISLPSTAASDEYPTRPITITTPTAAGGGVDNVTRIIADALARKVDGSVVVANKPGAGGMIGNQFMKRQPPDGYSLFMTANNNQFITPLLVKDPGFDPIKDFEPIARVALVPHVIVVNRDFPANDLNQFLDEIKSKPGHYQFGSAGVGTLNHMIPELLSMSAGAKLQHVPYKGVAAAVTDVIAGRVPILSSNIWSVLEHIRAGTLKAIAVSSAQRSPLLPDTPAVAEKFPGFEHVMWVGLYAPHETPEGRLKLLAQQIESIMSDESIKSRFLSLGMEPTFEGPDQVASRQTSEYRAWGETIKRLNIQAQ
ncbi:tripartite tricarboxylate transporter substrate binding protein [Parapusillimonas sp. SGNA-6]|nr:tripartite tricarboxylate transporter substrate binding protein [Parapusillimonas sp. SGNA-6]